MDDKAQFFLNDNDVGFIWKKECMLYKKFCNDMILNYFFVKHEGNVTMSYLIKHE